MSPAASRSGSPSTVNVASQRTPRSTVKTAVGEPVRAGHRAQSNHDHVRLVPRAVSELDSHGRGRCSPIQSGDAYAEAQVDPVRAMQCRAALAEERPERGHRGGGDVEERDLEPQLPGRRGHLAADEPGADDRHP